METDVGKERLAVEIASFRGMGTARTRLKTIVEYRNRDAVAHNPIIHSNIFDQAGTCYIRLNRDTLDVL